MSRHHVIILDIQKLILCRDLLPRDDLNPVIFPVRRVHKQIAEVARSFGAFHGLADVIHVLLILRGVRHLHDEPPHGYR